GRRPVGTITEENPSQPAITVPRGVNHSGDFFDQIDSVRVGSGTEQRLGGLGVAPFDAVDQGQVQFDHTQSRMDVGPGGRNRARPPLPGQRGPLRSFFPLDSLAILEAERGTLPQPRGRYVLPPPFESAVILHPRGANPVEPVLAVACPCAL